MAYRRARDLYSQRRYREALLEARNELKATRRPSSSVLDLVDEICMHSAATGDVIGFDGKVLQVLPADSDTSWLGMHAQLPEQRAPHTFNNIADALQAAVDGDVIHLLPGTHIVSQVSLTVDKRVWIEGVATSAQQVVLDHRANHPAFVISRSCVLNNFTIDMVGFCEAVSITGSSITVKPILRGLHVSCSGDDGFSIGGKSQPLMQSCRVQVRKCGIKQYDSTSVTLWQCSFTNCQHALVTAGSAQCFLEGCHVLDCSEDGVIGLEQSAIHLTSSCVNGCGGPGIDLSDRSGVRLKLSEVKGCCGGVWLWNNATCEAIASHIDGGSSYAVLLDAQAYACGSSCTIDGPCHDSSEAPTPDNIKRSKTLLHKTTQEALHLQGSDPSLLPNLSLETQSSSAACAGGGATVNSNSKGVHNPGQPHCGGAKHPQTAAAEDLEQQKWQQEQPCSPFSSDSCSGSSLHFCANTIGYPGSLDGSMDCSEDGSGRSCGMGGAMLGHHNCRVNPSKKPLVDGSMLVANAAAAAALFPPETGAFLYDPSLF